MDATTLVVVPSLLLNEKQVRESGRRSGSRFLANHDPNLHFALLTDLADSVTQPLDDDRIRWWNWRCSLSTN